MEQQSIAAMRSDRSGLGTVITIVALALGILLIVLLGQSYFTENVIDLAGAEHAGIVALTLAESAVQEMMARFACRVNDPADPLFLKFRAAAMQSGDWSSLPHGSIADTPRTRVLMAEEPAYRTGGFKLVECEARFSAPRPAVNLPFESFGSVSFRARVEATGRTKIIRTFAAQQDYKLVMVTLPRPFDQLPLCIRDAGALVGGEVTNVWIRQIADLMLKVDDQLYAHRADSRIRRLAAQVDAARRVFDEIPITLAQAVRLKLERHGFQPGSGPASTARIHQFQLPMLAFRAPTDEREPPIDGADIHIANQLVAIQQRLTQLVDRLPASDTPNAEQSVPILIELMTMMRDHNNLVKKWQDFLAEYDSEPARNIDKVFAHLTPEAMKRKAFLVFKPSRSGDPARELKTLQRRLGRLSGAVMVEKYGMPLDLRDFRVRGKLVIASMGDVVLGETGIEGESDRLTVVCFGRLRLSGKIRASLASMGTLEIAGRTELLGSLILGARPPASLAGLTVRYDPLVRAGTAPVGQNVVPNLAYYYVGMGPSITGQSVERGRRSR
jgi:hypothetical protein